MLTKAKRKIKTHLLKQPFHFNRSFWGSQVYFVRKATYGAGYVLQMSKCISLQMMHYGKNVLLSLHHAKISLY